jgi:hypothetical protein
MEAALVNSILLRPTRPCVQRAPTDCGLAFPSWVVGMVGIILFTFSSEAQAIALLYSSAFCGRASTPEGYNCAILPVAPPALVISNASIAPTISGTMWWDQNDSGTMDPSEIAIPGAIVQLYSQSNPNTPLALTTTNAAGDFFFQVNPGSYFLRNGTPSSIGQTLIPTSLVDPTNPNQFDLILNNNDHLQNLNFGELSYPTQLISKRLFLTSSDPTHPVPEPGVFIELLCAGLSGLMFFAYKYKGYASR